MTELCSIWSSQFSHYHVGLSLQSPGQGYPWQSDIPCSALGPGEHLQPRSGPDISTLTSPHLTSHFSSLQVAVSAYFFSMFGITVYMISDSVISRLAASHSHCYLQVVTYVRERPQKVSITPDIEQSLEYPTITICSPAFFSKTRLVEGGAGTSLILPTIQTCSLRTG